MYMYVIFCNVSGVKFGWGANWHGILSTLNNWLGFFFAVAGIIIPF